MNNPKNKKNRVSVIVPVYKVEPFLNRCIRSIVNQSYEELEIILVDDGSPDNCPTICDAWAKRDSRIKVIHKDNGGLSDARNAGMAVATGEYIAFVDSDDWIDKNYIAYLLMGILKTGADLSACDILSVSSEESVSISDKTPGVIPYSKESAMNCLLKGEMFRAVAWNKLYKAELLKNEFFPVGKLHEDEFFTYRILDKCSLLCYVDIPLYFYFQRDNSIMSENTIRHLDVLEAFYERFNFLRKRYPSLYYKDKLLFCLSCMNMYCNTFSDNYLDKKIARNRILSYRNNVHFPINEFMGYSNIEKLHIISTTPLLLHITSALRYFLRSR